MSAQATHKKRKNAYTKILKRDRRLADDYAGALAAGNQCSSVLHATARRPPQKIPRASDNSARGARPREHRLETHFASIRECKAAVRITRTITLPASKCTSRWLHRGYDYVQSRQTALTRRQPPSGGGKASAPALFSGPKKQACTRCTGQQKQPKPKIFSKSMRGNHSIDLI